MAYLICSPICYISTNVRLSFSKNGWMTSDVLLEWVRQIWGPNRDDVQRLLVLDQAPIGRPGQPSGELGKLHSSWSSDAQGQPQEAISTRCCELRFQGLGAVSEEVVARSFKRCGISTALDGSEDGELHERLASAIPPSAALPTLSNSMREEVVDLLFDSESDCSFDGFDDE
ncbi:hypothetical protein HPB48_000185 [Haemaphysalis longicornis]|uniref:Uncharacterized protein n=1 Tax=Haemaphysalis longicornis TaxID=44386 RepID=A0A9J6GVC3_HAELO|nr:hypothetical protein HPB48_000185 [Haemaphysalis longicornis]